MFALDVCFTTRDDWCAAREIVGSRFLRRFVLPRGSDGRVPSEILESTLGEVKVEEAQAAEASLAGQGEELDFSAFDSYRFPAKFSSLFRAVAPLVDGARVGLPCAIFVDDSPGPVVCPGGMVVGHPRIPVVVQGGVAG